MTSTSLATSTAIDPSPAMAQHARRLARDLDALYTPRRGAAIAEVFRESGAQRLLIVEHRRLLLRDRDGPEYFFHPNLALVRGLNLLRGERDLFASATGLAPGERLLDCTLGFACEATLGALLVGPTGAVVGLESAPPLAAVTRDGVSRFPLQNRRLEEALRRVGVVTADHREYLPGCESQAFDVVYFDPFFGERLYGSENSVSPLAHFGDPAPLDAASVIEARRVARRCVVIKHPTHEPLPPVLLSEVSASITTRKNRVQYDVLPPF